MGSGSSTRCTRPMHAQYPLASEANLDGSRSLRLGRVQRARREHGVGDGGGPAEQVALAGPATRSEEHTSELQSLMRISYAVFCLKKKKNKKNTVTRIHLC